MVYEGSIIAKELIRDKNNFPTKLYHFRSTKLVFPSTENVGQYLLKILNEYPEISVDPHMYAIAIAWGYIEEDRPVRACDIKSYKFDKPWSECNPDVDTWAVKELSHDPSNPETECETGQIVFGKEAQLRRTTRNLDEFLTKWPEYGDLEVLSV